MSGFRFYERIAAQRDDSEELKQCVTSTVRKLLDQETSTKRPGILLGRIQSGKTRAFIGIIGLAFDHGYDAAVVLTKGTVSLARQTIRRIKIDFKLFLDADAVQVFDIMALPGNLTAWELGQKLIFIVKKEDDNLRRLLDAFRHQYPILQTKRLLTIDDEADLASLSFRKKGTEITVGVISKQIDVLRDL